MARSKPPEQPAEDPADVVFDPAAYTAVTIVRTDEIEGHVYGRGQTHNVDAATLAAMREKGMVADGSAG